MKGFSGFLVALLFLVSEVLIAQERPPSVIETNRHIGQTQSIMYPGVDFFKGPYSSVEHACRAEVYVPGLPDGNYDGYYPSPISGPDFVCKCHSNPGNACGYAYLQCPLGWGNGNNTFCHDHPDAPWYPNAVCPTTASKTCIRDPQQLDPVRNNGACDPKASGCTTVGNPIHIRTGNKHQVETDVDAFGNGLGYKRYYNSQQTEVRQGSHGVMWRGEFDRRIRLYAQSPQFVVAERQDGKGVYFKPGVSGGTWVADSDSAYRLQVVLDGSGQPVGWQLGYEDQVERYSYDGVLERISGPNDTIELEYQAGILAKAVDQHGRYLEFQYGGDGRLLQLSASDGLVITYLYATTGGLDTVTYSGSSYSESRQYLYETASTPDLLTGIEDESQNRYATWGYDPNNRRATYSYHGNGAAISDRVDVAYEPGGVSVVTYATGETRTVDSEVSNGLAKIVGVVSDCVGCTQRNSARSYDSNGYLNLLTDEAGIESDHDYDAKGRLVKLISAQNDTSGAKRKVETDWAADIDLPTERRTYNAANTLVAKSNWTYNARGQALTATQTDPVTAAVRTSTTTYCESADITNGTCPLLGLVTAINGPRTDVADTATYTYYASDDASCASAPTTCPHRKGDLWKVTDALGRITETLAYDGAGRPLSVKDANGVVTDLTYHPRGWLTARKVRGTNNAVETDDQITQIEYWPTGLVKKVTQPDGAFTAYTYDAAHRLTDIADNAGNTIHYTLDNAGNRTAEDTKDSGGNLKRTLSRVYNQLGQLQTAKDAYNHATGFTYDANGNNQLVTDALSRVTDNDYDPLNRLARTLQDVGGIAAETKFEYDALDNLTKVTDPKGLDTTYQYNGFGDLTQLASPDTGTTVYTYDSAGNRKTQTDARGIVSTYSYDALNRLTGIAYPTSSLNVGYIYDTINPVCIAGETFAIGRLTQMTDSSGNTEYCYDRFGNLTRKRQTTNGQVFELRYAYTLAGQLQAITYPDGAIVDYVRDGQGRITEVGATQAGGVRAVLLNQATYHPFGPVASWVYGNGRTMSRPLNQNYQPTAVADNAAGGLSLGYEFDAIGNLSKLYNADQSVTKAQYVYDALNRLADVKDGPTGTVIEHYDYDATGNRISFTNAGGTTNYTYPGTSHRLTQVGATARTYDNVGNTIQIGGTAKEFVYNDAGRMSQVKASGTTTMNYQLNGKGEQVRKYLNTANTYTVYDEAGHWAGDYDNAGTTIQQAIWLDDLPIGLLASDQLKYLQPDHLGTPRVVIDPVTDVAIWAWELKGEAFGNTVPHQDPDGNGAVFVFNMRFPGQRLDAVTGLSYNYFRDYDASTGRYVKSDPIGLGGGISTYAYVGLSPLMWRDSFGLRPGDCYESADEAAANALSEINPRSIREDREYAGWIHKTANGWYSYTAPRGGSAHSSNPGIRLPGAISDYHTHGAASRGYDGEVASSADWQTTPYRQTNYLGTPSGRMVKYKYNGQVREIDKPSSNSCNNDCDIDRNENLLYRIMNYIGWYDP